MEVKQISVFEMPKTIVLLFKLVKSELTRKIKITEYI